MDNLNNQKDPISSTEEVYAQVREMAANFEFKPEERINESALSKQLGVSRTPLREALNRLVTEGLLVTHVGRGFFCRSLSPGKIIELYELREALEAHAIKLAMERASDEEFEDVREFLISTYPEYTKQATARQIVAFDEQFHLRLAALSRNDEIVAALKNLHERIRYVRWIQMRHRDAISHEAHLSLLKVIASRDVAAATKHIEGHIKQSYEETTEIVREAFSQMYVPENTF